MARVRVSELSGKELDWATGMALKITLKVVPDGFNYCMGTVWFVWRPTRNWSDIGIYIEKLKISISAFDDYWFAYYQGTRVKAEEPLTAVCRAIVAMSEGEYMEIPECLK